jgi:uncharacterized protein
LKFTLESPSAASVRKVSAGEIRIGNDVYTNPVAITPDGVFSDWTPAAVETLSYADLAAVIATAPALIIVGTGSKQILPNRELMFAMARAGIGLECMDTAAAARTFNVLLSEGRPVAAVLYMTDSA